MNNPELFAKLNYQLVRDNANFMDMCAPFIKWKNNEIIMDIGTSDGRTAKEAILPRLPKNFKKFVGCDISEVMVTYLKKNFNAPKTEFVQFDISSETIPYNFINKFDHIFSFYVLHYMDKRQPFINMFKMTKPGGQILVTFCATLAIERAYREMSRKAKWAKYEHSQIFSIYKDFGDPVNAILNMLKEIGFKDATCRLEDATHFYYNHDILREFFISLNPVIPYLPKEEIEEYCKEYIEEVKKSDVMYSRKNEDNRESFEMKIKVFVVFASKPTDP